MKDLLTDLLLICVISISVWTDLKESKIYNKITIGGMLGGIILNTYFMNTQGLIFSLKGLGLAVLIFILPFYLGGIGGGDVKLLASIGAIKGVNFLIFSIILAGITGGIIALLIMIKKKNLLKNIENISKNVYNKIIWKIPFESEGKESFPYAIPIFFGVIITLLWEIIK